MANTNPSPSQLVEALRDHGVPVRLANGWDTNGRPWKTSDSPGLMGCIVHHTATASAVGSEGAPSLNWLLTAYDRPAANMLIGRGDRDVWLASAGSCWHCGTGGPWPAIGVNQVCNEGYTGAARLFGIEIDDAGRRYGTITQAQITNTARTLAALNDLCGWPKDFSRIATHQAWTDGSYGVNPKGPSPYVGRKGDTLHKAWGEWPGSKVAEAYNPIFWRQQAAQYQRSATTWDGVVPGRSAVTAGDRQALWRLQCRLFDLGALKRRPQPVDAGPVYPKGAIKRFQSDRGWTPHGDFSPRTQKAMFGKVAA